MRAVATRCVLSPRAQWQPPEEPSQPGSPDEVPENLPLEPAVEPPETPSQPEVPFEPE